MGYKELPRVADKRTTLLTFLDSQRALCTYAALSITGDLASVTSSTSTSFHETERRFQ